MNKRVITVFALILILTSIFSSVSFASTNQALEEFLEIFTELSSERRELGSILLKSYLNRGDSGVEDLKEDLELYLNEDHIQLLESMGYSLGDIRSELDVLKKWNVSEKTQLIDYISSGNSAGIRKLVKEAGKSTPPQPSLPGPSNTSGEGSTTIKDESLDEKVVAEDLIEVYFTDIENHKYEEVIRFLAERGIIEGKSKDSYDPDGELTRAEFMALIFRVIDLKTTDDKELLFKDVSIDSWYYKYIKAAYDSKIINGTSATTFSPNDKVSREQMVSILMRILRGRNIIFSLERTDKDILMYDDADRISNWAAEDMFYGVKFELIEGRTEKNLNPRDNATRGEAADIIKKLYLLMEE